MKNRLKKKNVINNKRLSFIIKGNDVAKAIINLGEREDRVLTIVKGKYGFKNKSDAVNFVISKFEEEFLEPKLRPEYVEKLNKIEKGKTIPFKSIEELEEHIKNASLWYQFSFR